MFSKRFAGVSAAAVAVAAVVLVPIGGAQPRGLPRGVTASIAFRPGVAPFGVAVAYGSVWVSTHRSSNLYRINPRTNKVIATIDVGQDSCGAISAGAGQIWVGRCDTGRGWIRVDARKNRVAGIVHGFGLQVAFGGGSAWVPGLQGTKELLRVNPATGATISTINLPSDPVYVLYVRGTVWTLGPDDGALVRIDATQGKIVETSSVPRSVAWAYLTMANGLLWLGSDAPAVLRYDPATKKLTKLAIRATPDLGDRPLAAGAGSLWWRTTAGVVSRIDPASGKVVGKYPADDLPGGGQNAVGFGSLWVANFEADTVWRVRIGK